jgi:lysozyme family protein
MISWERLISDTFDKEGRKYGDENTKPPIDQPTAAGGITLGTLSDYVAATNAPLEVSVLTLRRLNEETATPIVRWKLEQIAKQQKFDQIAFEPLNLHLIDFSYNSGPSLAIRWLQRVLRVGRTGRMDSETFGALAMQNNWLVHQALLCARLQMIDMWTDADAKRKMYEEGLENRVLSFSLLAIP